MTRSESGSAESGSATVTEVAVWAATPAAHNVASRTEKSRERSLVFMVSQSPPARRALFKESQEETRAADKRVSRGPYYLLVGGLMPPSPGRFALLAGDGAAPVVAGALAPPDAAFSLP